MIGNLALARAMTSGDWPHFDGHLLALWTAYTGCQRPSRSGLSVSFQVGEIESGSFFPEGVKLTG